MRVLRGNEEQSPRRVRQVALRLYEEQYRELKQYCKDTDKSIARVLEEGLCYVVNSKREKKK